MKKLSQEEKFALAQDGPRSADTLNRLSAEKQKEVKEFWDAVPLLHKPYPTLLKDIQEKKRIHDQSTFGEIEEFDPEANVCGTNMCTAGHLVNMAGEPGYKLKDQYGWATAAAIIHQKAHPNIPHQNFSSIPQDWAIAYIEEMAKIENKQANE